MADIAEKGTLFTPELVSDLFNKVKGKSTIAALCGQDPIPFTGSEHMTFSMDNEVALVGESEEKTNGGITLEPVTIIPVKIEYGARVSDEFMYASDEKQLQILAAFNDGFAAKAARGIDIMAMHKMNPRTAKESDLITNSFKDVTNVVDYDAEAPDDSLNEAISNLDDYDCTGLALSKVIASAMGKMKASDDSNVRLYPEFAFGAQATAFYGTPCSVNSTVNFDGETQAIVGDFSAFKWGITKEIPLEVIRFGDPDNTGKDLAGHNQVYLRSELYVGWGILDPAAFCKVVGAETAKTSVKTTSAKASSK